MLIDFEKIRGEIYSRYNISLPPDDPILIAVALNELVLDRYIDLVSLRYEAANRELTISLQQQVEQSKEIGGRIITDAADYVSQEVRQAVANATRDAAGQLRQQIADAQALAHDAIINSRDAQTAKSGALIAAALAGAAAVAAVAALVVVLVR